MMIPNLSNKIPPVWRNNLCSIKLLNKQLRPANILKPIVARGAWHGFLDLANEWQFWHVYTVYTESGIYES